jgi:putative peptidoglycan lipid II flippase
MSRLTRISILLAFFFALDKGAALIRLVILNRQFGFSKAYDAFNVANNIPDMLFTLISGGALAVAFIPVLSETLTQQGKERAWNLFSKIANLAFLVTGVLAILVALLAGPLVRSELGIAPGFEQVQQDLVVDLMRLNLIATMIFAISGLAMAGLQANQSFLLPAMAPLLYNLGLIFGALILAPGPDNSLGPISLPGFGFGIYGLVYGTILGAALHLGIQVPGLLRNGFRWAPQLGLNSAPVRKVLRLMGPRVITMFMVQMTFLVRDNLASRLEQGSVSALTLGYLVVQVPETLIGTAIGTALLPTLSELVASQDGKTFHATLQRAVRVILALTIPIAVVLALGIRPLLEFAFRNLTPAEMDSLVWVVRGFLAGLVGECLLEVASRSFYARQDAVTPLIVSGFSLLVFLGTSLSLFRVLGAAGISLSVSIALTFQSLVLLGLLSRRLVERLSPGFTVLRALGAALLGGAAVLLVARAGQAVGQPVWVGIASLAVGGGLALLPIWREIRLLLRL